MSEQLVLTLIRNFGKDPAGALPRPCLSVDQLLCGCVSMQQNASAGAAQTSDLGR